jgi:hypothetical protein
MTGARLETSGQIRNSYPYIASTSVAASLTLSGSSFGTQSLITFSERLPFDATPDKSGRVFMCINGVFLRVTAQAFTPTAPTISGWIFYQTLEGKKIYLTALEASFSAAFSESNPTIKLSPDTSFNAQNLNAIGYLGYEDIATSLGSATSITISAKFNLGFYGDYSEPDWEQLFQRQQHEHTGLPAIVGAKHDE